jgi:hypothetical protein
MVDINLFDDEEEQSGKKGKTGDSSAKKDEGSPSNRLKEEDFNFDEDLSEPILNQFDSDVEPVFEEESHTADNDKSSKGAKKPQTVSPALIIILLLVVGAFIYFLYVYLPSSQQKIKSFPLNKIPTVAEKIQTDTSKFMPGSTVMKVGQGMAAFTKGIPALGAASQGAMYIEAAKTILENLSRDGQFGGLLLKGDQFFVGYGSETKGMSQSMGQKIKTLLAADGFKAAPEEQSKALEGIRYFGLISGNLPRAKTVGSTTQKWTVDQFIGQLNTLLNQQALSNRKIQKFPQYKLSGRSQTPIQLRVDGNRKNAMAFLESLKSLQGNVGMLTLQVHPFEIADLRASQVKMVIDFSIQ